MNPYRLAAASRIRAFASWSYDAPRNVRVHLERLRLRIFAALIRLSGVVAGCGCCGDNAYDCLVDEVKCDCACHRERKGLEEARTRMSDREAQRCFHFQTPERDPLCGHTATWLARSPLRARFEALHPCPACARLLRTLDESAGGAR